MDRSVDYNTIDVSNIVDIYKYLMKKHNKVKKKIMFKLIKEAVIALVNSGSLSRVAKVSDRTMSICLNNEPCLVRPALIDLNSNELHFYPYMVNLGVC